MRRCGDAHKTGDGEAKGNQKTKGRATSKKNSAFESRFIPGNLVCLYQDQGKLILFIVQCTIPLWYE
jgi:hypothetical protein